MTSSPENPKPDPEQGSDREVHINASVNVQHSEGGRIEAVHIDRVDGQVAVGFSAEDVERLLLDIRSEFQVRPFSGESPYVGLQAFQEQDAGRFFGRERLIEQLVGLAVARRFIALAGPSGSGKSSLIRAGFVPALKNGAISASREWLYATMRPGRDPMTALGRAVAGLAGNLQAAHDLQEPNLQDETVLAQWLEIALGDRGDRRAVLLIDQFEELFTQLPDRDQQRRLLFLNQILHAAQAEDGRALVIITLRSDFIANCAAYPALNALLNQGFLHVGAMEADELVSAIARPALQAGLQIDPDLIAQIIADMRDQPGALPLMQFALQDLFEASRTPDGIAALTLEAYLARGGLHRALERYADQAFYSLAAREQRIARAVFAGLVQPGQGRQDTRRTALFSELVPAGQDLDQVESVIHKLADARLVITAERDPDLEDTGLFDSRAVTLAHERLLEAWPWLRRLVDENREAIARSNQINADAQRWQAAGKDESYLYSGARLAAAEEAHKESLLALSKLANQFLQDSIAARDAAQQAARRRIRITFVALAIAVLLFALLAGWGFLSQREANQQAATAEYSSTQAAAQAGRAVQAQELAETRAA